MITSNTLIDNSCDDLNMARVVSNLIEHDECKVVKIATGYWDIPGTALLLASLQKFLQRGDTKVQLLIGNDPIVRAAQQKNPKYKNAKSQADFIRCDLQNLEVKDEYVGVVKLLKKFCLPDFGSSRIQIKMCKTGIDGEQRMLHAKCYIFVGENFAKGIIGSSNFTQKGLEGNAEVNYLEWNNTIVAAEPNQYSKTKGHIFWFEEMWNIAQEWNKTFLEEVLHGTPVEKKTVEEKDPVAYIEPLTPYELYIKLLNYKFGEIVDLDKQQIIESYVPPKYNKIDYQLQAVRQCFTIMREHGGFMLGDVVGLGKTVVGTLIIKHFLTLPEDDDRERQVLIITPPAIKSAWENTIKDFDESATNKIAHLIDIVTTGSVGKLVDIEDGDTGDEDGDGDFEDDLKHKNYGLIIIDESHKFRNSQTVMYKNLDDLIYEIGSETGVYPYVGLLSATLQNNRPQDIQNQLYLFERNHTDTTLKKANGGNLENFFANINNQYASLIAKPRDENGMPRNLTEEEKRERQEQLKQLSLSVRQCVLEDILVRRTRTDIIKYYPNSGITFPKICGPNMLTYEMDDNLAKLFALTMDIIATELMEDRDEPHGKALRYYRYRAIEFLVDKDLKAIYKGGNIDPDRYSKQLARIMQINLVKRIESSFAAFKSSLRNLQRYTQNMIDMWNADTIFICPDIDVNAELDPKKRYEQTGTLCTFEECVNDIREKIKKLDSDGRNKRMRNRELHRSDFKPDYIDKLQQDNELIKFLCVSWADYTEDPKMECFKENLRTTLFDKQRNPVHKLVIFSEAIDTVKAIENAIKVVDRKLKVLTITAGNRDKMQQKIQENFDANYPGEQKNDYQVIITTEVLAEGVNLHRANCILNYDTPWNSTRLMQRIGRVNRIGSTASHVYVYNFMPSAQGNEQIGLIQKAHTKLQSFHTLFGEDAQVFTDAEEVIHYDLNTAASGEESPMEKYLHELKEYKTAHPQRFAQIVAMEEGLEMATPHTDGCSYFLVRNKHISGMFVAVDANLNAKIISGAQMYSLFRPDEDAVAQPLPDDWKERKEKAVRKVNQELNRMNIRLKKSKNATLAKGILNEWQKRPDITKETRDILACAFDYVNDKGNNDIIKRIIKTNEYLKSPQLRIFENDDADINDVLTCEIKQLVNKVEKQYGKAEVYMGMSR